MVCDRLFSKPELETTISLDNLATDVEGDPLTISVLNPVNGTVIFNPLTNKASFKPATGFSGIASFDFLASDAFGSSTPARVTVNVSDVPLLNLDFVKRNPILNAGENTELIVLGDFADQKGVVLPDSYLTYTSFNPEVAPIDAAGKVTGLTNGTSILSASRNNLQAVTPIRIGTMPAPTTDAQLHQILAEMYGLDPYPDAVSLSVGSTRKLSLGLNSNFTEANLTAASTGTRYFSNNSNILNVSPDGTITAVGIGDATVTAIHGTASATIPVRVEAPKIGTTALGTDGGIINSSDGTLAVMIPPGALKQNATVSIAPVNQQNLSLPLPPGFEFAGAFNLNFGDNSLNIPAQLAVPAPAGLAPGTVAYFLRKGAIPDATGTWNPIWLQEESGIVGDDGNIRTQSPPYPGVVRPGEYAVVYASPTGSATLVKGQLTLNYNFPLAFFGIIDPLGNIGQLIDPDKFVTTPAFTVTRDISSVQVVAIPKVGLPVVTEVGVQRNDDGTATFKAALNMPAPTTSDPTTPPVLQKAELKFKDENNQQFENNEPLLFLTGGNILVNNASDSKGSKFEDLTVKFYAGNSMYEGTVVPTRSRSLGGNQYEVAVKVPDTVVLGASGVVLERKQNQTVEQKGVTPVYKEIQYNSNPIRLPEGAEYVFAALGGSDRVAVLNGKNPESVVDTTNSKDLLLAQIPVGTSGVTDWAESTAVTSDGNRVYATLRNSGQVALVDPMVLRQVDTVPNTSGVNPIVLPAGARPKSIVISPRDDYAYIGDLNQAKIYVLDINPNSATYHKVVETINVTSPLGLSQLAISSDGRRLFGTGSDNNEQVPNRRIYAINIDSKDRPKDEDSNPRKWHQQIGVIPTISETEGISATNEPTKMVFTNGLNLINTDQNDGPGFGVLEITSDDPLNFTASVSYAPLSLGFPTDYFDVNEGVSVTVTRDGRYGFVAGRNSGSLGPYADVRSGGNIGIIKDPLGPNPQLIGATRPIPEALTNDLVLSNDNKYLYGSYPSLTGSGSVYAFDVEEMIKTLDNPGQFKIDSLDRGVKSPFFNATTARSVTATDFARVPIDDINPAVSIAADYGILQENRPANQFTYGVLPQTTRAPVGTGGNLRDLSSAPTDWLNLKGPGATTNDLTPTFQWQFAPGWEDVKEVNLFVSTFEQGKGLLPWDKVVNLSDSALLPGFSETQKRQLLSKPWNGYDDFNPNRILTATWKKDTGKWYGHDGITPLDQPLNDLANTSTNFTLPRSLTAGQNYNFAVEAVSNSGAVTKDLGQFKTLPPDSNSPFSSVSVLTHGFTLLPNQSGIPDSFFQMANKIATVSGNTPENSGLIMRYDKPTGNWIPIDLQGRVITDLTGGLNTSEPNYLSTLANNLKAGVVIDGKEIKYLNKNKPLVLLTEWSLDRESVIPDVGFSEGAADAIFASMVQLDLALGGGVGEYEGNQLKRLYDSQGKLIRQQGDLFNSPMHFMGFSRGTVVNSEIVQRLGTFFPQAGGTSLANRDLQMTTIDPHDFYQPSLNLQLPGFISTNFSDFYEPKIQVWNNVTWADNYYQNVADPNGLTATPNGRALSLLPQEELNKNPKPAGLNFPQVNGEGVGEGWFYSVLGGGKDQRTLSSTGRVPVSFDNTLSAGMRGDYAVPTLFNGNFDQFIPNKSSAENFGRNLISKEIPGWSFHNGANSTLVSPINNLVEWSQIAQQSPNFSNYLSLLGINSQAQDYQPNYALKLGAGESITHNRFVVPDWGNLRFDIHAPVARGKLRVTLETLDGKYKETNEIYLAKELQIPTPNGMTDVSQVTSAYLNNVNAVGFGRDGFETFQMNLQTRNDITKQYRGQPAILRFELEGGEPVYLDNVFFKSDSLNFGNPTEARWDMNEPAQNPYQTNLLLEKPQYTSSHNAVTGLPNWVSWQVDNTWSQRFVGRTGDQFIVDPDLPGSPNFPTWPRIDGRMYQGSGLDKGHLVPDKDRNRNQKDALATYMSTNLIPQAIDNNRLFRNNTGSLDPDISPAWSRIESKLVEQLIFDYNKKLDITAGVFDTKQQNWSIQPKTRAPEALTEAQNQGNTNPTNLEANGIRIPGWTWKTILVSNKSNLGVQDILGSYTYITPNIPEPYTNWIGQPAVPNPLNQLLGESREPITSAEQWRRPNTWRISINQLENLLNAQGSDKVFNFLSNLPEDVRNRIKQQSDFQFPPP
ncbi:DNA/RNA non-specific endonuclease [Microcoleus sp.]|uniref:DNA/RNA non-specific endonuclease n=1 Tax=Microcoleus sp. TaxID=44472 RepID=UPI0035258ED7